MKRAILEDIYREVIAIRERLEALERIIVPEEKVSQEELDELRELKETALKGDIVPWDDIKEN
jgi:hypothetical protein